MNKKQIEEYVFFIEDANRKMDNLEFNKNISDMLKLRIQLKKLAKEVIDAIIELQVLDFLESGHNNPDAQDVEYN